MVAIYVRMILNERMTLDQVPTFWRNQVQKILEEKLKSEESE